ncbi:MAG: hypothetical protein K2X09_03500 [Rickettsiales bacterium]|nr:hypothetical protein [Rickettsiales bacterium]
MAGEKTQAQLQAETAQAQAAAAAAKAREDEAARAEEEHRRAAASEGLWGFVKGFIPDFSFFNIIIFAALAVGAYMLGKTETGVSWLEQGIALLPESWQPSASGLLNKIGIKTDIAGPLLRLAAKDIDGLRETLKSSGLAPAVIATIAKSEKSFTDFLKPIMDAHKGRATLEDLNPAAILAGPALATYLKPENRASTVALIKAALPANAGISEKTLAALIAHGIDENGNPTPQFKTLIAAVNDGRLQKLQTDMNDATGKFSLTKAIDVLLNHENRALIRSIGTDTIAIAARDKSPALTPALLNAALAFGDAIDKNPANGGANRARTVAVLHALTNVASGIKPEIAFKDITAEQLSGFFKVPDNQVAVGNLMGAAQPALKKLWGNANEGLVEVLASTPDSANILRFMKDDFSWLEHKVGKFANAAADLVGASLEQKLYWAGSEKISENSAVVAAALTLLNPAAAAKAVSAKR